MCSTMVTMPGHLRLKRSFYYVTFEVQALSNSFQKHTDIISSLFGIFVLNNQLKAKIHGIHASHTMRQWLTTFFFFSQT